MFVAVNWRELGGRWAFTKLEWIIGRCINGVLKFRVLGNHSYYCGWGLVNKSSSRKKLTNVVKLVREIKLLCKWTRCDKHSQEYGWKNHLIKLM